MAAKFDARSGGFVLTPARLLYTAAGKPASPKPVGRTSALCWLCGLSCDGTGVPVLGAIGESFTDHSRVAIPSSTHVCVPCVWVMSGRPPDTFRLFSVVWRTDRPLAPNHPKATRIIPGAQFSAKNDLTEIKNILLVPPSDGSVWFCAISNSGKKHVVPFTKLNLNSLQWIIRLEDEDIHGSSVVFKKIFHCCVELRLAGFSNNEILKGNPFHGKLVKTGIDFWRKRERFLNPWREGGLLSLAIFLLQGKVSDDIFKEND